MINVTFITNNGKVVLAPDNSNLLRVSLREKGGIPYKCGAGLCGTCRCRIEQGLEHMDAVKEKERKHLSADDFANGYRMACQTFVNGDVSVSWQPKSNGKTVAVADTTLAAAVVSAQADSPFSALAEAARLRMLEIGPTWNEDIAGHRKMEVS